LKKFEEEGANCVSTNYVIKCIQEGTSNILKREDMDERMPDQEWRDTLKYPKYKIIHLNEYIHNEIGIKN
jgi:hypothetical protein